jgi:hypothetical protein
MGDREALDQVISICQRLDALTALQAAALEARQSAAMAEPLALTEVRYLAPSKSSSAYTADDTPHWPTTPAPLSE